MEKEKINRINQLAKLSKERALTAEEKSEQQELVEDLVQIITVFSCKLQGKQANKAKKMIQELVGGKNDDKVDQDKASTQ